MKTSSIFALGVSSFVILVLFLAGILFQVQAQSEITELPANSAAPTTTDPIFNYQGELRNAAGSPITNSSLAITFRLFPTSTGGSACWSENRNVSVQSGQFSVVLGQMTPIPYHCVAEPAYLELVINGETLTPREALTAVATAVTALQLPDGAEVDGNLRVADSIVATTDNAALKFRNDHGNVRLTSATSAFIFVDSDNNSTDKYFQVLSNSDDLVAPVQSLFTVNEQGDAKATRNLHADGGNLFLAGQHALHIQTSQKILHLLPFSNDLFDRVCIGCGVAGRGLIVRGGLELTGDCRTTSNANDGTFVSEADCEAGNIISGAYIEANLMNTKDRAAEKVDRFEEGDLLCWSGETEQLEKCSVPNDPLVMGVADSNGKPIVLGAEDIKVIGRVEVGDYLVASPVPGYAMASENPSFGVVIGQALEANDGDEGVIKAMIRKM